MDYTVLIPIRVSFDEYDIRSLAQKKFAMHWTSREKGVLRLATNRSTRLCGKQEADFATMTEFLFVQCDETVILSYDTSKALVLKADYVQGA